MMAFCPLDIFLMYWVIFLSMSGEVLEKSTTGSLCVVLWDCLPPYLLFFLFEFRFAPSSEPLLEDLLLHGSEFRGDLRTTLVLPEFVKSPSILPTFWDSLTGMLASKVWNRLLELWELCKGFPTADRTPPFYLDLLRAYDPRGLFTMNMILFLEVVRLLPLLMMSS